MYLNRFPVSFKETRLWIYIAPNKANTTRSGLVSTRLRLSLGVRGEGRLELLCARAPANNPALRREHRHRLLVEVREVGRARIRQHARVETAVVGLAEGGLDADLCRDATDEEVCHATLAQPGLEPRVVEGPLPWLEQVQLAFLRLQLCAKGGARCASRVRA